MNRFKSRNVKSKVWRGSFGGRVCFRVYRIVGLVRGELFCGLRVRGSSLEFFVFKENRVSYRKRFGKKG